MLRDNLFYLAKFLHAKFTNVLQNIFTFLKFRKLKFFFLMKILFECLIKISENSSKFIIA